MNTIKEPQISRFSQNHFYSNNRDKAVEQFVEDISKLYIFGYNPDEIKKRKDVNAALKYLDNKFRNFSLDNCVNYVFAQDEIHHNFGLWYQFDFMLPLHVYNFAKTIIDDEGLDFEAPLFSSFIFFLIVHYKSSENNAREEIRDLKSKHRSEQNIEHLRVLKANKQNARVFYKPQKLYGAIGIEDQHTFRRYVEAIPELDLRYRTTSTRTDDLIERLYIFGINKLLKRVKTYIKSYSEANDVLSTVPMNDVMSGVDIATHQVFKLHQKYEKYHIRNKNLYLSYPSLINNSIIKIERFNNRIKCFVQSEFADFTFIFNSLYKTEGAVKPLFRVCFVSRPTAILNKSSDAHLDGIRSKLIDIGVGEKTSKSGFYSKFRTPHFEQIKKCMPILREVSNNGLLVDKIKLVGLKEKYREMMKAEGEKYSLRKRRKAIANYKEDEKDFEDIEDEFLKYRSYHLFLVKLLRSTKSIRNDGTGQSRIYGLFTPHGASTHRMTCHNVNLQGIPKVISSEILKASEGKVLLSADVSGQDIMVAANLAKRLYSDIESFPEEYHQELNELAVLIEGTIEKLKFNPDIENQHKPIDFIADQMLLQANKRFFMLSREQIRKSIKKIVYVVLYGGGERTAIKSATYLSEVEILDIAEKYALQNSISTAKDLIYEHGGVHFPPNALTKLDYFQWETFDEVLENLNKFKEFCLENSDLIIAESDEDRTIKAKELISEIKYQQQVISDINNDEGIKEVVKMLRSKIPELIYESFTELLKEEYPGILESFKFYNIYYKEYSSTYPTLLGWTTPTSPNFRDPKQGTRSKSYPIQASGAEFLREWLIELTKSENDRRIEFDVVNVIHDQIVVETPIKYKDKVGKLLIDTAKVATMNVGLDEQTLHFGNVNILS